MSYCLSFPITVAAFLCISLTLRAQEPVRVTLHLEEPGAAVSPGLYGLMTEEINFSYEGGLYGELIRNRSFKDSAKVAAFWSLMPGTSGKATMSLDKQNPVSPALPVSLRLDVENAGARFLLTIFFYAVHEVVYFLIARGLVGSHMAWSWPHELISGLANAVLGVFVFMLLDRAKQRT